MAEFILVLPIVLVLFGALFLMLVSKSENFSFTTLKYFTIAIATIGFFITLYNYGNTSVVHLYPKIFGSLFILDKFSSLFDLMFFGGTSLTLLINNYYFKSRNYNYTGFFTLILFALFGMLCLSHANELVTAFIALEISSLSIYVLAGYKDNDPKGREAMMKYIVLGSLTSTFFILGTALIYGVLDSTSLDAIRNLYMQTTPDDNLVKIGVILISITILFKIGAVPFHAWVVEVYKGAPFPATMFMASTFKIALFAIALRIYLINPSLIDGAWITIMQTLTVLTLVGGSWIAITQNNLKRMLAGSSIVHSGYLLIALSSLGLGSHIATSAITFYLISYFISSVGAFGILSFIAANEKIDLTYESFKGLAKKRPYLSIMMTIFLLSLSGFPSTIGFLGKFYIFMSAIETGQVLLVGLGIMMAFISIFYYFKLIAMMYFHDVEEDTKKLPFNISTVLIAILAIVTVWGGIGTSLFDFMPGADGFIDIAKDAVNSIH